MPSSASPAGKMLLSICSEELAENKISGCGTDISACTVADWGLGGRVKVVDDGFCHDNLPDPYMQILSWLPPLHNKESSVQCLVI